MRTAAPVEAALAARPVPREARRRAVDGLGSAALAGARVAVDSLAAFALALLVTLALLLAPAGAARAAEHVELTTLDLVRDEEGVFLNYGVEFDLSRSVEDALAKGVPLFFVAEAQVYRDRWYWRDRRVADAVRVWRIVYQPLTASYRVTFGALSQTFATRSEAFAAISRGTRWKIAEPGQIEEGAHHYLEFSYRLDTNLLPRPMQIGVGGQPDWQMNVRRTIRIN